MMKARAPLRRDFAELEFSELHDLIFPGDVRREDKIQALIRHRGDDSKYRQVRVWRISPLGIELFPNDTISLTKGDPVDLKLSINGNTTHFEGLVVDFFRSTEAGSRAGIRLSNTSSEKVADINRRQGIRWICSSQYNPVCVAHNPAQFNDFLYFKIRDISRTGFRLVTSLRNKFIVPGTKLDLQVSFPMTSQVAIPVSVARVGITSESGRDYLEVGVTYGQVTRRTREVIGQYLVQFSDAESLKSIREEGYYPTSFTRGVDYQFIKSDEEYKDVLNLRHLANAAVNKIDDDTTPEDMGDIYDLRGRILVGKYRGRAVATARLVFTELDQPLEHEEYITWPSEFPPRNQVLELSRACTHPDFRGGDLWFSLIQHITITALHADREWALISTTPELIKMYEAIGFRDTGITYEHKLYPGHTQVVMLVNTPKAVSGVGVGPIRWNVIWHEVAKHALEDGSLYASASSNVRMIVYRACAPLAALLLFWSRHPRRRKKRSRG